MVIFGEAANHLGANKSMNYENLQWTKAFSCILLSTPNKTNLVQPLPAFSGHGVSIPALITNPRPELERALNMKVHQEVEWMNLMGNTA